MLQECGSHKELIIKYSPVSTPGPVLRKPFRSFAICMEISALLTTQSSIPGTWEPAAHFQKFLQFLGKQGTLENGRHMDQPSRTLNLTLND